MARLESRIMRCPECGRRHDVTHLAARRMFPCDRCDAVLVVPEVLLSAELDLADTRATQRFQRKMREHEANQADEGLEGQRVAAHQPPKETPAQRLGCPRCQRRLELSRRRPGLTFRCEHCHTHLTLTDSPLGKRRLRIATAHTIPASQRARRSVSAPPKPNALSATALRELDSAPALDATSLELDHAADSSSLAIDVAPVIALRKPAAAHDSTPAPRATATSDGWESIDDLASADSVQFDRSLDDAAQSTDDSDDEYATDLGNELADDELDEDDATEHDDELDEDDATEHDDELDEDDATEHDDELDEDEFDEDELDEDDSVIGDKLATVDAAECLANESLQLEAELATHDALARVVDLALDESLALEPLQPFIEPKPAARSPREAVAPAPHKPATQRTPAREVPLAHEIEVTFDADDDATLAMDVVEPRPGPTPRLPLRNTRSITARSDGSTRQATNQPTTSRSKKTTTRLVRQRETAPPPPAPAALDDSLENEPLSESSPNELLTIDLEAKPTAPSPTTHAEQPGRIATARKALSAFYQDHGAALARVGQRTTRGQRHRQRGGVAQAAARAGAAVRTQQAANLTRPLLWSAAAMLVVMAAGTSFLVLSARAKQQQHRAMIAQRDVEEPAPLIGLPTETTAAAVLPKATTIAALPVALRPTPAGLALEPGLAVEVTGVISGQANGMVEGRFGFLLTTRGSGQLWAEELSNRHMEIFAELARKRSNGTPLVVVIQGTTRPIAELSEPHQLDPRIARQRIWIELDGRTLREASYAEYLALEQSLIVR